MKRSTFLGVVLAFAGAALDFFSSYQFVIQSRMTQNDMGVIMVEYDASSLEWGVGLSALGALLLGTALLNFTGLGMRKMHLFGILMATYGVIMLFIGFSMYSGIAPIMTERFLSSIGMFIVGFLMLGNGVGMTRSRQMSM
jgi:hypothetical protein